MSLGIFACHLTKVDAVSLGGTAAAEAKTKWFDDSFGAFWANDYVNFNGNENISTIDNMVDSQTS